MNFNFLNKITRNDYFISVRRLASGSVIATLIGVIASPFITRIYSPEEFGFYALVLAIISMVGPIINAKYDLAIVTAKTTRDVFNIIVACFLISIVIATISSFISIIIFINSEELSNNYLIFAAAIFIILIIKSVINILNAYNNRNGNFDLISNAYVTRTLGQNSFIIAFGIIGLSVLGMVFSQILGSFFGIYSQGKDLVQSKNKFKLVRIQRIKELLKENYRQIVYLTPAHFLNSGSYSLLNFIILFLYGPAMLGFYALAYKILGLPLSVIGTNISKVYFKKANDDKKNKNDISKVFLFTTLLVAGVSLSIVIFLVIFSPTIFSIVFGEEWRSAGEIVQVLAPMFGFRLIVSSIIPTLMVLGQQKLELILQGLFIITILGISVVSYVYGIPFKQFLLYFSIGFSLIYLLFYFMMLRYTQKSK